MEFARELVVGPLPIGSFVCLIRELVLDLADGRLPEHHLRFLVGAVLEVAHELVLDRGLALAEQESLRAFLLDSRPVVYGVIDISLRRDQTDVPPLAVRGSELAAIIGDEGRGKRGRVHLFGRAHAALRERALDALLLRADAVPGRRTSELRQRTHTHREAYLLIPRGFLRLQCLPHLDARVVAQRLGDAEAGWLEGRAAHRVARLLLGEFLAADLVTGGLAFRGASSIGRRVLLPREPGSNGSAVHLLLAFDLSHHERLEVALLAALDLHFEILAPLEVFQSQHEQLTSLRDALDGCPVKPE